MVTGILGGGGQPKLYLLVVYPISSVIDQSLMAVRFFSTSFLTHKTKVRAVELQELAGSCWWFQTCCFFSLSFQPRNLGHSWYFDSFFVWRDFFTCTNGYFFTDRVILGRRDCPNSRKIISFTMFHSSVNQVNYGHDGRSCNLCIYTPEN